MPDCHGRSGGQYPTDRDAASACAFQEGYGVLPKQFDIYRVPSAANPLFKINFSTFFLSTIPQSIAAYFEPKEKLHLLISVFTI